MKCAASFVPNIDKRIQHLVDFFFFTAFEDITLYTGASALALLAFGPNSYLYRELSCVL